MGSNEPPRDGTDDGRPLIVWLDDVAAEDRELTGGKGAALAAASRGGAPTIDGFVVTTAATARIDRAGGDVGDVEDELRRALRDLQGERDDAVVARSSSVIEDADDESMAGRYETVANVTTWEEFVAAIGVVLASREDVANDLPDVDVQHPIAVVVQRQIDPDVGGVAFGVDPVTGRPDRRLVSAAVGAPEELVSGETDGDNWLLDDDGHVVDEPEEPDVDVDDAMLENVAALLDDVEERFGSPQDVEWAANRDGEIFLLQSRPVTTEITGVPTGPELGTGPIAETFPDQLATLERDLWLVPLRRAIAHALPIAAVASEKDVEASPVVLAVDGRPAVDLELFGRSERNRSPLKTRGRRIRAAWRLGRLRGALPLAAARLVREADATMAQVAPLRDYDDGQILDLLERCRDVLTSLHGHEVLVGLITNPSDDVITGSGVGLRALHAARRDGLTDHQAIARDPSILALYPPRIGGTPDLPDVTDVPARRGLPPAPDDPGILREALRMRVRWVQELTVRAAMELGRRLVERDLLDEVSHVRDLELEALSDALHHDTRPQRRRLPDLDPLPNRFRLTHGQTVVPVRGDNDGGVGAGGGSGEGEVHVFDGDVAAVPDGAVLVTPQLGPELASVLSRLSGLVAETGSPLSHVAILAREADVATVVSVGDARDRFADGDVVVVDGGAGDVTKKEKTA